MATYQSPYRDHMHWTRLSKGGKRLIITSTRPDMGPRGGHDEWISCQNPKGEWQEPLNLGDTINTSGEDMCWTLRQTARRSRVAQDLGIRTITICCGFTTTMFRYSRILSRSGHHPPCSSPVKCRLAQQSDRELGLRTGERLATTLSCCCKFSAPDSVPP